MAELPQEWKRNWRKVQRAMRDWPLVAMLIIGTLAMEGYGVAFALDSAVHDHMVATPLGQFPFMGLVNAALVITFASMAQYLILQASIRRNDPRKAVRDTAITPASVAIALMALPMTQFASGIAWERQKAEHTALQGSVQLANAQAVLANSMADLGERAEANIVLQKAAKPARAQPTFGEWVGAIFLYGFWALAAGAGRAIEPEKPAERQRRERREERSRAEERRMAREKAERDAEKRAAIIAGIPFVGDYLRRKDYPGFIPREAGKAA